MKRVKKLSLLARLRGVQGFARFGDSDVAESRGMLPGSFLVACRDVARLQRLDTGWVELVGKGKRQHLRFSRKLSATARQAISNCWTPPSTPGGGGARKSA